MKKLIILFLWFWAVSVSAQEAPPIDGGNPPEPAPESGDGVPAIPIDGGITAFLVAGGALGVKLIYSGRKQKKNIT